MNRARHISFRMQGFLATLLAALALAVQPLVADADSESLESPADGVAVEEHVDPALQPLTARELRQAVGALQRDIAAAMRLAGNQRVRTVSVERHEEDKDAPAGRRRADVTLYNYDTNETISAIVTLGASPQVEDMTVTAGQPPGLGSREVEEARRLALAHPAVQAELRANGLAGSASDLFITHIRVQPAAPGDPCSTDRCVVLFFNTRDAVLEIEPIVNLTTGEVEIQ